MPEAVVERAALPDHWLRDEVVLRLGKVLLGSILAVALLATFAGANVSPTFILAPSVALLGGVGAWILFRHPLANLCVLIVSFAVIADFEAGIQVSEVLFALYYFGFLGHWALTRVILGRSPVFDRPVARAAALFLVGMSMSVVITVLFRGDSQLWIGEWVSLSFLALYFPVREAVRNYRHGARWVVGALFVLATFVLLRNILMYRQVLDNALYVWQVTRGRAVTNTAILMVPLMFSLVYLVHQANRVRRISGLLVFSVFLGGVVLSQSRGYWLAFAVGAVFVLVIARSVARRRLVVAGMVSAVGLFAAGYVLLGDLFFLTVVGLLNRALSISTAATEDISLVNRWRETSVVLDLVKQNPIMGYGLGTQFRFYDLQFLPPVTVVKSFLHNGYLALWYKLGLWGLGLVTYFWGSVIVEGVRTYRRAGSSQLAVIGFGASAFLVTLTISAITSNPFSINDPMFVFAVTAGLASGAFERARDAGPASVA